MTFVFEPVGDIAPPIGHFLQITGVIIGQAIKSQNHGQVFAEQVINDEFSFIQQAVHMRAIRRE